MKIRLLVVTAIVGCVSALLAASDTAARATATGNERAARRDASLLLSRLALPAGAVRSPTEPSGDGGHLKPLPALDASTARVDVHAWWQVPGGQSDVLAYLKSHPPAGSKLAGSGGLYMGGKPIDQTVSFVWPAVRGVLGQRTLAVTVIALDAGRAGVLAQAQSDWIVLRSSGERVPRAAHEVDVASGPLNRSPTRNTSVVSAATVRRLVSIINGLPIVQPAVYSCPALLLQGARVITLSFRTAAAGRLLARATYIAYPHLAYDSGPCNSIALTIAGRSQKPLVGGSFLRRVERLLGVALLR
jgi:hypothetical protein